MLLSDCVTLLCVVPVGVMCLGRLSVDRGHMIEGKLLNWKELVNDR